MGIEKKKTGKPGTKAIYQKEDLIAAVIKMRLEEMASVKTIIDFLTNTIGMCKSNAYEYLKWAREEIKEQYNFMNPSKIEEAIGQYEEALERARALKDWRLWNDLKKEHNKIMGIHAKTNIDVTTNGKDLSINEVLIKIITDKKDLSDEDMR